MNYVLCDPCIIYQQVSLKLRLNKIGRRFNQTFWSAPKIWLNYGKM